MSRPMMTAVVLPAANSATAASLSMLPAIVYAATMGVLFGICAMMMENSDMARLQRPSLRTTGREYLMKSPAIIRPGLAISAAFIGRRLLHSMQPSTTTTSNTRLRSVATAAPAQPSAGAPHLPKMNM